MKIDRLIGILSILLQEEKTTAPELAERFEVSRRTINRDIEALCSLLRFAFSEKGHANHIPQYMSNPKRMLQDMGKGKANI